LEAVIKEGWSADPQERPSFKELEPALHALSLDISKQQETNEGERAPQRLTDVTFRRIPEEEHVHRRTQSK
jgi:hypothetical protein